MILFSKIFSIVLAFLVVTKTFYDFKKHQEGIAMLLFWTITWIAIVYVALVPSTFYNIVTSFSRENVGLGTFFGIAFIFLFFITYRIYAKANRLEQKIKDMVMKIGIKDIE